MDFYSLARKELQALCKKNKIPANMTNVAMADALKALEKVEGLDEVINAPRSDPQQSPEKTSNPEPRTVCRTSTRRKPINVEPESSQLLTGTRRTTRRTSAEEAKQENKNVNLQETPAMPTSRRRVPAASTRRNIDTQLMESGEDEKEAIGEEKSDVPETPAIQSSRSKAPAVSSKKKMEGKSVQKAYGTRQSVRLLEKNLADLSLKEERTVEVVKIEGLCEETEQPEQKDDVPGGDSEIDQSLENEGEVKHEVQVQEENKTVNDHEGTDNAKLDIVSESCSNLDSRHSGLDAEDKSDGSSGESPLLQVETSEKALDVNGGESTHENGPDVVTTENSETVTAALEPESEEGMTDNQDSLIVKVSDVLGSDMISENSETLTATLEPEIEEMIDNQDSLAVEVSDDTATFVMETENISIIKAADEVSAELADILTPKVSEVEDQVSAGVIDSSEAVGDDSAAFVMETNHISIANAAGEVSVKVFDVLTPKVSEVEGQVSVEVMDLSEVVDESSEMNLMADEQHGSHDMHSNAASEEDSDGNGVEEESDGYESDDTQEDDDIAKIIQNEKSEIISELLQNEKCRDTSDLMENEYNNNSCDHDAIEAKIESTLVAQESVEQNISFCPPVPAEEIAAMAAHESIQTLDKSPCKHLVSGEEVTGGMVSSPFAVNTIQGQFPRPTASTPRKSSSKKQATIQKIILADINKENIDSSGRKVEPKKDKVKKKQQVIYDDMSLIQLRKKLKELAIVNNNNEGRNVSKVETRSALQILPENCMAVPESEQKN